VVLGTSQHGSGVEAWPLFEHFVHHVGDDGHHLGSYDSKSSYLNVHVVKDVGQEEIGVIFVSADNGEDDVFSEEDHCPGLLVFDESAK
jgi:hypothetical protein